MKKIILFVVIISFPIYSQQIPTTVSEAYKGEVKFDFTQSTGRMQGEWMQGQSMPFPRYYGGSVMATVDDTTWLYIFGGDTTSNGDAAKSCLRYNVDADYWEYIDSLPGPLRVNSAARLGNKLYTMGGFDRLSSDTATTKFFEYDITANTWNELPGLPDGIFFHKAVGYQDSLIYIIGGIKRDSTVFLDRVLLFNINTQQFREATPLPEQKANFAPVVIDNSIIITGGFFDADSLSDQTIIGEINQSNRAEISYSSLVEYPIQLHAHFGFPGFNNEEIIFFGGSSSTGFNPVNDFYSYKFSGNLYDTLSTIMNGNTAFYSGYSHVPINSGADVVITAVIAGGIIIGPSVTGQTWVYRDTVNITSLNEFENNIPSTFSLKQNYPNPFNPTTTISWQSPVGSWQTIKVYDILGREVATLINEYKPAGNYKVEFSAGSFGDGLKLSSGTYFYMLQAGEFIETKKLILLK